MTISRPVAIATLAVTMLAGGVGGAMLLGPAGAEQSSSDAPSVEAAPAAAGRCGHGFEALAEKIGISTDDLRAALQDGQTIAEVAEANGTDPQDVIDALAARATQRITKVVNGDTVRQRC